jgi:hypothetical protein
MKSVIVMGNARSGTSMTAGLLSILGVQMGGVSVDEMKENQRIQNPKGSFENPDFIRLTSDMHKDWKDGMRIIPIKEKYDARIQEVVSKYQQGVWGFKSAAVTPFIKLFMCHMHDPHIVTVLRNVYHNAQSWQVHMRDVFGTNVTIDKAMQVMSKCQIELVQTAIGDPRPNIFVTYEDIKKDSWAEAQRLGEFLNFDYADKEAEVKEFIMPSYSTLNAS